MIAGSPAPIAMHFKALFSFQATATAPPAATKSTDTTT
jgi:hypothetical protein